MFKSTMSVVLASSKNGREAYMVKKVDSITDATCVCKKFINVFRVPKENWTGGQVRHMGEEVCTIDYEGVARSRHGDDLLEGV